MSAIPMTPDVARLIGRSAEGVENRSLLHDKFIFHKKWPQEDDNKMAYHKRAYYNSIKRLVNLESSKESHELCRTRSKNLMSMCRDAYGDKCSTTIGTLKGRLAINLDDGLIDNAGICLDRLHGSPYIPGAAVKGACRHAGLDELNCASNKDKKELLDIFCAVFGAVEGNFKNNGDLEAFKNIGCPKKMTRKGSITFMPAYPINEANIVVDITNVHYPAYYATGYTADLAIEQTPMIFFPAVEVGAQFAFCLILNNRYEDPRALDMAKRWLRTAITERGIGAKIASGYGWFSIDEEKLREIEQSECAERDKAAQITEKKRKEADAAQAEATRRSSLSPEELATEDLLQHSDEKFGAFAGAIASQEESRQHAFIRLLLDNKDKRERWKTWKKMKKPEFLDGIRQVAEKFNLTLP
jgi:CRISPR type III-B/RAMP module RAMP protein Cmr6